MTILFYVKSTQFHNTDLNLLIFNTFIVNLSQLNNMFKQLSLCTATLLLAGTLTMQAQEKKNFIGGSLGFSSNKTPNVLTDIDEKRQTFSANLAYAHYIRPKLALGLKAEFYYDKYNYSVAVPPENNENKSTTASFSPFARYDIPLWKSKFAVFNDLGVSGIIGKVENEGNDQELKTFGVGAFYQPGISFRAADRIGLQASFGNLFTARYTTEKNENTDLKSTNSYVGINGRWGIDSFTFGVNLFF